MFSEVGNGPAKLIEEFRKKSDKPILKGAFIEEAIYIGDEYLKVLSSLKSKEELIGDIIKLLQSPIEKVTLSINAGNNLARLLKGLSDKKKE